jgi:hypothetical protein
LFTLGAHWAAYTSFVESDLRNLHELAFDLRLPVRWLEAMAREGVIPSMRVGRRLLFNISAVRIALANAAANEGLSCGPILQS